MPPALQPRAPPAALAGLPPLPLPTTGYRYVVAHFLFITVTRRSLALATSAAATAFAALQASSLVLTTTPAEGVALALTTPPWAGRGGRDVVAGRTGLTLLLSLRFLALVFDEARGLALGLAARGIDWNGLGSGGGIQIALRLVGRLFRSLQERAADVAVAMRARGFAGPGGHRVHASAGPRPRAANTAVLVALALAALARAAVSTP